MKYLIFLIVLHITLNSFGQNVTVNLSPSSLNEAVGQVDSTRIYIIPAGGFNQQLSLTSTCISPGSCTGITISFPINPVNFPYSNGAKIIIDIGGNCTVGQYQFQLKAINGPVSDSAVLTINVLSGICNITPINHYINNCSQRIIVDDRAVWLGQGPALIKYDRTIWTEYNSTNSQFQTSCLDMEEDSHQNLWMATGDGVVKFDGTFWTIYNSTNSNLPSSNFISIAIDSLDNIWVSANYNYITHVAGSGLFKFDGTDWTKYDSTNTPLPSNAIGNISFDKNGSLWVTFYSYSTHKNNIAKYDGSNWTFVSTTISCLLQDLYISKISFDSQNNAWFGLNEYGGSGNLKTGLVKTDGVTWELWTDSSLTPYNHFLYDSNCSILSQDHSSAIPCFGARQIFIDHYDRKWIAESHNDYGRGLILLDGNDFSFFNSSNSLLPDNSINGIGEYQDTIWFSSTQSWSGCGGEKLAYYSCGPTTAINSLDEKGIISVYPNPAVDNIIISSFENGIFKIFDLTGKQLLNQSINNGKNICDISHISNGFYVYSIQNKNEFISGCVVIQR